MSSTSPILRRSAWLSIGIAFLIRLFLVNRHPLTGDELLTMDVLGFSPFSKIFQWVTETDTQMPLYYALLYVLKLAVGQSILIFRLFSVFWCYLAFWQTYLWAKELLSEETAVLATAILSFSFVVLHHSLEIRPYTLLLFLGVYTMRRSSRLQTSTPISTGFWLQYTVGLSLLALTHYYGIMLGAVELLLAVCFMQAERRRQLRGPLFIAGLVVVLLVLPLAPFVWKNFAIYHTYRKGLTILQYLGLFVYLLSGTGMSAFLLVLCAKFIGKNHSKFARSLNSGSIFLAGLVILPVLIAVLKNVLSSPSLEARYLICILSPLAILTAQLIVSEGQRAVWIFSFVSLLLLSNIFWKEQYAAELYRLDTQGAAQQALAFAHASAGAQIISCNICLRYYMQKENVTCSKDAPDAKTQTETRESLNRSPGQGIDRISKDRIWIEPLDQPCELAQAESVSSFDWRTALVKGLRIKWVRPIEARR